MIPMNAVGGAYLMPEFRIAMVDESGLDVCPIAINVRAYTTPRVTPVSTRIKLMPACAQKSMLIIKDTNEWTTA
jgi:hypothetical protein